jgi:hypothetical protein
MEKLSPILAFYTVKDWREGCEKCIEILRYGGLGHTLGLHTRDEGVVRAFALRKPAYRICVNTPAALGAVGYTTNLFPAMTLGCGTPGNNITSDNISPMHLIHIKRVAYGVREADGAATSAAASMAATPVAPRATGRKDVRPLIESVVDRFVEKKRPAAPSCGTAGTSPEVRKTPHPSAPPLGSYAVLAPKGASAAESNPAPKAAVPFVCEDDVRSAMRANKKILIGKKTIVTPSARDLAGANDVFATAE